MKTKRLDLETRFSTAEDGTFEGYASVWGIRDSYGDVVKAGAFAASLTGHKAAGTKPLMLWMHDPSEPVGVWEEVAEDAKGLRVKGRLVLETRRGAEAHALLKAGALDGLSIGFRTVKASTQAGGGRLLEAADLIEISLVTRPANGAARVTGIKSAADAANVAAVAASIRRAAATLVR